MDNFQQGSCSDINLISQILADDSDNVFGSFKANQITGAGKVLLKIPVSNFEPEMKLNVSNLQTDCLMYKLNVSNVQARCI